MSNYILNNKYRLFLWFMLSAIFMFFLHNFFHLPDVNLKDNNITVNNLENLPNFGNFIHITDIHADENYKEGASVDSFCHKVGKVQDQRAGKYGALGTKCDSSIYLIEETFTFMQKQFSKNIDFIIDTGDVSRHSRDASYPKSREDVLKDHIRAVNLYKNHFNIKKIQVIPTLGNNDAFEHDLFKPNSTLFYELANVWAPYRLDLTNNMEFLKGGYFSISLGNGFKAISLNSLLWYKKNKALADCDEGIALEQMKFLNKQLELIRSQNEKVYIIGHIPPHKANGKVLYKKKCYKKYVKLIGEYSKIINGYFHGHTNKDYLSILIQLKKNMNYELITLTEDRPSLSLSPAEIVTVIGNGPSIIPVNHPAIRLYNYNIHRKGLLMGYTQYYANLTLANINKKLEYEIEYQTQKDYKMLDLSLSSWRLFLPKLLNSKSNLYSFYSKFISVSS